MTTLTKKLLSLYEENEHLTNLIEDVDFLIAFKELLMSRVENEDSIYFNPSKIKCASIPSNMLALELLFCLSKDDEVFEKHYFLACPNCEAQRREKELKRLFVCTSSECTPLVGEALSEFIMMHVHFQFSISEKIKPLILEEINKKIKKGVE